MGGDDGSFMLFEERAGVGEAEDDDGEENDDEVRWSTSGNLSAVSGEGDNGEEKYLGESQQ